MAILDLSLGPDCGAFAMPLPVMFEPVSTLFPENTSGFQFAGSIWVQFIFAVERKAVYRSNVHPGHCVPLCVLKFQGDL